jgi:hypothetical protein
LAVYRNDQVDFSFAAEIGAGGYLAPVKATADSDGDLTTTLDVIALPGAKTIGVASTTGAVVGEYIQIGTAGTDSTEIRKIVSFVTNDTITLNAPVGYYHAASPAEVVQTVDTTTSAGTMTGLALVSTADHHMRFTPGAWESIDVPDPTMEIEPRYFLGAESKRAFYTAYKGQQSFSGTLSNFELLNGYPLRFPLGTVSTAGTDKGSGGGSDVNGAVYAGQYEFDVTDGTSYDVGDYIAVGKTLATCEVRKIVSKSTHNIHVDYPFLFDHADEEVCDEVQAPYTHTIVEAVELPGVSWQVKNRDSSETATNDWIRRYFGGKIGQATLTAEEGGTLRMSWESAPFLDMNHNQYISGSTGVNKFDASNLAATVEFPTSEPYYFSQGSITLFGVEFARITNFTININNNLEPRYFIRNDGSERTPSQIFEGRREYSMTATVVLPDSISATSTTNTIFKELLAEGDYGSGMAGFDIDLVFTRTASTDTFTINIPANQDGASGIGGNNQGAFIRSANTSVSTENPVSTEVDILFRNMSATVVDSEPVYP